MCHFEELAFSVFVTQNVFSSFLLVENNMNGTATIVGSASSNNGNSQHIGDNIVLVTTTTDHHHQLEITNSDHDIINNNNILSMANANGNSNTIQQGNVAAAAPTTTDEELTPLHWLHDKNLLKGTFFYIISHILCSVVCPVLRDDDDETRVCALIK